MKEEMEGKNEKDRPFESDLKLKFFQEKLSAEELYSLEELLKSDPKERKLFNELRFLFGASDAIRMEQSPRFSVQEDRMMRRLKLGTYFHKIRHFAVRSAAILALPLLLTTTILLMQLHKAQTITYNQVSCLNSRVSMVDLPDGSKVYLHAGSTLRYPSEFSDKERLVELQGEGFFEVESDPNHPFYVQVPDGSRVKAYGTAFNVSAYGDNNNVLVFLAHGKVDFSSEQLAHPIVLNPGIELIFNRHTGTYKKTNRNAADYTDWIDGKFVFNRSSMSDVVEKLSRHYNVEITVNDQRLNDYFFCGSFKDENIYEVLNMLKKSSPRLIWKIESSRISNTDKPHITLLMKSENEKKDE